MVVQHPSYVVLVKWGGLVLTQHKEVQPKEGLVLRLQPRGLVHGISVRKVENMVQRTNMTVKP